MTTTGKPRECLTAFDSATFGQNGSFRVDKPVGSATISPCGRDVALASRQGLHIIDLDSPWSPPRHLAYHTPWEVADVQWSPFAARDYWVVSTSNQKALVWNLNMHARQGSVEHVLHAHTRAISDINFSAHYPDILATCAVDSFVHCWDLRHPSRPAMTFCDWFAGATQVKWNRTNPHILASSHDKFLRVWDDRKGSRPLKSIEAHATKIYGIDWNRFETTNLVTCSLDRTIKFWDYTQDTSEPERILHTAFPVWRARHTPFGYGLLAMPQRGDHDLHLYDRRTNENVARSVRAKSVHTFEGHHDQVKEFLWRPRGNVSATMDERDYQLVSWGADRVLRLHQVTDDVLQSVGYQKGMEVKRTTAFTRKGAPYKTFRDRPKTDDTEIFPTAHGILGSEVGPTMRLPSAMDADKFPHPITGGRRDGDSRHHLDRKGKLSRESDPISWMRGVKIGKRSTSQPEVHRTTSAVMSPTLQAQPIWDVYESLGEEITAVGEKFSKIKFEDVDMQRHRLVVFLPGPWGPDGVSTYIRVRMVFPSGYPSTAAPVSTIENMASVPDETLQQLVSDADTLASEFLSIHRTSLETILRYFLGEQSVSEVLQSLRKYNKSNNNLTSTQDDESSSSDDENEGIGAYAQPQSDSIESINPLTMVNNAQYNVPSSKTCGALWAVNGTLVCFFLPKLNKEASLPDQSIRSIPRNRSGITEGFGKLHEFGERRKGPISSIGTIEDEDSEFYEYETSSSDSSFSSKGIGNAYGHFLPAIAWKGSGFEMFPKIALDESQKSVGELGTANSTIHKTSMFISLHDESSLLPSKQSLAREYEIGNGHQQAAHNALVADSQGFRDIADAWALIDSILQDKVPLQLIDRPLRNGSIIAVARDILASLRDKRKTIDISIDADDEMDPSSLLKPVIGGASHSFGHTWLIQALFYHFEQIADLQMLAMMSCTFGQSLERMNPQDQSAVRLMSATNPFRRLSPPYASMDVATSLSGVSLQSSSRKLLSATHSETSSAGASVSDQVVISQESNTPPSYRTPSMETSRRDSQTTNHSASPEQHRHTHRSSSNLSTFAASFARPFSFNSSAASSPPNGFQKKASPSGSYVGPTMSSVTWASTAMFNKPSTNSGDHKSNLSISLSDNEDDFAPVPVDTTTQKRGFVTTFMNKDWFRDEGNAHLKLLDSGQKSRYTAYREAYGDLLLAWGLPFVRCEILKYNERSPPTTNMSHLSQKLTIFGDARPESVSVQPSIHCASCGCLLHFNSTGGQCPNCLRDSGSPSCVYCSTYIHGMASPCFNCGHVLHESCRQTVLGMNLQECVTGCGCLCSDHPFVEVPPPEENRIQSTRYGRGGDASPAITVIADSGVNEQEMAGWKGSEWEEMAYESLARNLRGERRSSTTGGVLRKRGSSIWRGG